MTENDKSDRPLCSRCSSLLFRDNHPSTYVQDLPDGKKRLNCHQADDREPDEPIELPLDFSLRDTFPDLPALTRSAEETRCPLCRFLLSGLRDDDNGERLKARLEVDEDEASGEVELRARWAWKSERTAKVVFHCGDEVGLAALVFECRFVELDRSARFVCPVEAVDGQDELAAWLGLKTRITLEDYSSRESIDWIKDQISACDSHNHTSVLTQSPKPFLPKRLLALAESSIRLVETDSVADPRSSIEYLALSYCWGSPSDAALHSKTTRLNLESRLLEIPEDDLTDVVRDAVRVTRLLGFRYLWVDALCIVQQDRLDWEEQCSQMGLVYRFAALTLCATSSSSCLRGFLARPRSSRITLPFRSAIDPSISGVLSLTGIHATSELLSTAAFLDVEVSRWYSRAWTFQERYMSSRRVYFGSVALHFLCGKSSSSYGSSLPDGQHDTTITRVEASPSISRDYPRAWANLGFDATMGRGALASVADTLPSLAGVAAEFHRFSGRADRYLAGLWASDLWRGLLWNNGVSGKRSSLPEVLRELAEEDYVAPSWSWVRHRHSAATLFYLPDEFGDFRCEASSISAETTLAGSNPFGAITGGTVEVQGRVCSIHTEVHVDSIFKIMTWEQEGQDLEVIIELDWRPADEVIPPGELNLMLLASASRQAQGPGSDEVEQGLSSLSVDCRSEESRDVWGLVLCPAPGFGSGVYYRIGMFGTRINVANSRYRSGVFEFFQLCEEPSIKII